MKTTDSIYRQNFLGKLLEDSINEVDI